MRHRVTYTVCALRPGRREAKTEAVYSDADFAAMFSAEDRAALLAGQSLITHPGRDSAWPRDVRIERRAA